MSYTPPTIGLAKKKLKFSPKENIATKKQAFIINFCDRDLDKEDSNDEDSDNKNNDGLSHDDAASDLECLRTQLSIVQRLIFMLGPQFQVSYSPVSHPDFHETTTLQGCIGRTVFFCGFCFVDVPSVEELNFLRTDCLLGGFRLAF